MNNKSKRKTHTLAIIAHILFWAGIITVPVISVNAACFVFGLSIICSIISIVLIKRSKKLEGIALNVISIVASVMFLAISIITIQIIDPGHDFRPEPYVEPEPLPASTSDPITLSRNEIVTASNKNVSLNINIYNIFSSMETFSASITCNPSTLIEQTSIQSTNIPSSTQGTTTLNFKTNSQAEKKKYLCTIKGYPSLEYSKDIILTIQ